ncbi:MAG: cupin domain-containing protein [Alphaproteobacteria bacterium]
MDQQAFKAAREAEGYTEFAVREWAAGTVNDDHTHDFSASALVLDGELTIECADGTTTCRAGDTFALDAGIPHKETVGGAGVKFLVARK